MLGGGMNGRPDLEIKMDSEKTLFGQLNPRGFLGAAVVTASGLGLSGRLNAVPTIRGSLSPAGSLSTTLSVATRTTSGRVE